MESNFDSMTEADYSKLPEAQIFGAEQPAQNANCNNNWILRMILLGTVITAVVIIFKTMNEKNKKIKQANISER